MITYDEEPEFLFERRIKHARREHKCDNCSDPIKVGDAYDTEFGKMPEEKPFFRRYHRGSGTFYSWCPRDIELARIDNELHTAQMAQWEREAEETQQNYDRKELEEKRKFFASNDCPTCLSGRRRCTDGHYLACSHVIRF